MPIVIWTQIANAFTMVSPFIAWWRHRKVAEKQCLTRMLAVHIPISFLYHLVSGLNINGVIKGLLKRGDLALIHIYAMQACRAIKRSHSHFTTRMPMLFVMPLNTYCIIRVCQGYEDTLLRMSSLYICTHDALRYVKALPRSKTRLILFGTSASVLFYFDDQLKGMGHSLFHIILGPLHHEVLELVDCVS